MEKIGNFRGSRGDSERQPNNQKHTHIRAEKRTLKRKCKQHTPPPPPPTHTGGHMYRIMCIAGAIIGIAFIIVLIKAMKEEII